MLSEGEKPLLFFTVVWNERKCVWKNVWSQVLAAQEFSGQFYELEHFLNPFYATGQFLYPMETEKLWFSDVFRGYRRRPAARKGLTAVFEILKISIMVLGMWIV